MDNNAFSKMYFTVTKDMLNTPLEGVLLDKYKQPIYDDEGNKTGDTTPTWGDVIMMLPHRYGLQWNTSGSAAAKICLIRDTWSARNGELSAMLALGAGKPYPRRTVMTNKEARELLKTNKFTPSE